MHAAPFDPWSPHASVLREKMFEHLFLGDLTRSLLRAGRRCEVLRPEYDGSGYDLVMEADGVLRHVQLKAMRSDGKRAYVDIHVDLASKPSGCVVWMLVDPESFTTRAYRWFGASAGRPLPDLGDRSARHTKADSSGLKAERPMLRRLPKSSFQTLDTMDEMIERLFGDVRERDLTSLRAHLREQPPLPASATAWQRLVRHGEFDALPERLDELEMVDFVHLVDGYALAGHAGPDAMQMALNAPRPDLTCAELLPSQIWAAMFVEHRRLRFENRALTEEEGRWFDESYQRLQPLLVA
ncbi:MAG TPA: hypothetical protein VD906_09280 [Caulobacteraceae bacterium]|nr:hypothetical protein [Caulobacteraceae bacterium]